MGAPVWVESGLEKEARGSDDSKNAKNQIRGSSFGDVCNVAQIVGLLAECIDYDLPQTFKITEGQVYLPLLSPCAGRRYGRICHIWKRQNRCAGKVNAGSRDPSHSDDKQSQCHPFSSGERIK